MQWHYSIPWMYKNREENLCLSFVATRLFFSTDEQFPSVRLCEPPCIPVSETSYFSPIPLPINVTTTSLLSSFFFLHPLSFPASSSWTDWHADHHLHLIQLLFSSSSSFLFSWKQHPSMELKLLFSSSFLSSWCWWVKLMLSPLQSVHKDLTFFFKAGNEQQLTGRFQ